MCCLPIWLVFKETKKTRLLVRQYSKGKAVEGFLVVQW